MPSKDQDPTLVRNQPALRTSHGRIWLVVGGIFAVICVAVLLLQARNDVAWAVIGAVVVVALYCAMIVARFMVPPARRLVILACVFAAIPVWTIIWLLVIIANSF
ncbi:hypothetical protein [Humibacter sp. RRB41]|uniref:hypothetical protein n=1 Tax=Humibacter sp. RRB41 TaxID=2919946 RepID=UPI001FA9942D|nr:hypothetical protein [Humibacter sp. RRB41]